MSLTFSFQNDTDSKYVRIRQAINAINDYLQSKAEETAIVITKHLQSISLSNDLSIFDPHLKDTTEFFICLYELMNRMEQRSPFSWHCVDVLQNACRNPAARDALITTYQFIPTLSRLLGEHLTLEKKIELLKLMQDLSCGIRISWQIPHLPHLMKTLANWIESQDMMIVSLSLGVLVNLCYKNLPAIYTLSGNVDIKRLMRICTTLEGPAVELHTCKLLIILNFIDDQHEILTKLIHATFKSILDAFHKRNSVLLRQIVLFFLDAIQGKDYDKIITGEYYNNQLNLLINLMNSNPDDINDKSGDFVNNRHQSLITTNDPECMALIFQFLLPIMELTLKSLLENRLLLINIAMRWIQNDIVSSHALSILRIIITKLDIDDNDLVEKCLEPLVKSLPIFLNDIASVQDEEQVLIHLGYHRKISGLFELLNVMLRLPKIRQKMLNEVQVETICKVFVPLLGNIKEMKMRASAPHTATSEAVDLYVNAISFINELAKYNANWINVQTTLLANRQIHMVLAQALTAGCPSTKKVVLEMCRLKIFPTEQVAEMMVTIQPLSAVGAEFLSSPSSSSSLSSYHMEHRKRFAANEMQDMSGPVLSIAQVQRLDDVLEKFKKAVSERNLLNIATSDVMELYEYKLASAGHSERIAMASIEAASERCTQLQHRIAQFTSEINRYHQLLLHAEQCQEKQAKVSENLKKDVANLAARLESEKTKNKQAIQQLTTTEAALAESRVKLENCDKKIEELKQNKQQLIEQYNDLKQYIGKIEENATRLEKNLLKKDQLLEKANHTIDALNTQVKELEDMLKQMESDLAAKNAELMEVTKEALARKHILDTITKVATSQVHV